MSSFNKVILIGRLTRDPELRYTPNGKPVANFTLAVDRNRGGQGQDKETDFIDCVVWQQTAEFASKYVNKGRLVCVEGRIQIRTWDDKETGQKRKAFEIVCNELRTLDRRESGGGGGYEGGGGSTYDRNSHSDSAPPMRETVYSGAAADNKSNANFEHNGSSFEDDIPF